MKKIIFYIILLFIINSQFIFTQSIVPNLELSIEEQIEIYFTAFKNGNLNQSASRYASYIVSEYRTDLIPFLKIYLEGANYLNLFFDAPNAHDYSLDLISNIFYYLHIYSDPIYSDIIEPYTINSNIIQFFVNIYKSKIDEYIIYTKKIDNVILLTELNLQSITGYALNWEGGIWIGGNPIENYGHPDFYDRDNRRFNFIDIQRYYSERLGIDDIVICDSLLR